MNTKLIPQEVSALLTTELDKLELALQSLLEQSQRLAKTTPENLHP